MYTNAYLVTLYFKEHGIHRPEQTERVRQTLLAFLQLAPTVDCSAETVQEAVNDERFTDIEDSFQYHCALQNDCDVLLTRLLRLVEVNRLTVTAENAWSPPHIYKKKYIYIII